MSLMLSLPGAPVLVYGDEIGMGDDLDQPDRVSVRIPMQWASGKNGGFSTSSPDKLIQPAIRKGLFSFEKVNVESQEKDPNSLLNRVRALVAVRRSVCTLLRGRTFAVAGDNEAVHVRCVGDGVEFVVTAHNLSGRKQNIELRFGGHFQAEMSELLCNGAAVEVREQLSLSLPAYGYHWFRGTRIHG